MTDQEQHAELERQIAGLYAAIDELYAAHDAIIAAHPEELFDLYGENPEEALACAERLGWDWFLDSHQQYLGESHGYV